MTALIPAIHQLGYVVPNLADALHHWTVTLKVGPFFLNKHLKWPDFKYRGQRSSPDVNIAVSCVGGLQIELIEQCNDEPSAYRDFLDAGGDGVQHLGVFTERADADLQRLQQAGFEVVQAATSSLDPATGFWYLAKAGQSGPMIELIGISAAKSELFARVARASASWDGSDPVRII